MKKNLVIKTVTLTLLDNRQGLRSVLSVVIVSIPRLCLVA